MNKKCVVCDTDLNGSRRKFCTNNCKNKYWYLNNKEVTNPNAYYRQTIKAIKRKLNLIDLKGGCCEKCGYNKNLSALEFHHINEGNKDFPLDGRNLSNRNWIVILEEFGKCELLCANCHREYHNNEMVVKILRETIDEKMKELNILNDYRVKDNNCVDCNVIISKRRKLKII